MKHRYLLERQAQKRFNRMLDSDVKLTRKLLGSNDYTVAKATVIDNGEMTVSYHLIKKND